MEYQVHPVQGKRAHIRKLMIWSFSTLEEVKNVRLAGYNQIGVLLKGFDSSWRLGWSMAPDYNHHMAAVSLTDMMMIMKQNEDADQQYGDRWHYSLCLWKHCWTTENKILLQAAVASASQQGELQAGHYLRLNWSKCWSTLMHIYIYFSDLYCVRSENCQTN